MFELLLVLLLVFVLDRWVTWYWTKIGFPGYGEYLRQMLEEKRK